MSRAARLWLAVGPAALAAGAIAVALVLTSDHEEAPVLTITLGGLAGWSFIAAGLIARTRRPENRTGLLMIGVGFTWFAAALSDSNHSLLWTLGVAVGAVFVAVLVHLLLAYPTGRLASRRERAVVTAAYVLAGSGNLAFLLFDETPVSDCEDCPSNAFLVTESDAVTSTLTALVEGLAGLLILAVLVVLALRWRRATPAARRLLTPILLAGGISLFLLGGSTATQSIWPSVGEWFGWAAFALFAATPVFFLSGILRSHLARAGLGPLMREHYTLPEIHQELRRILRDPTAILVVWLEGQSGYIDAEGRPYELPTEGSERAVTAIGDEHGPLGALVHDPALRDEELLGDLAAALRMNLQHLRSTVALEASERRSRALLHALPDNMYRISRAGVYLDFHAQDETQLQLEPEKLIGSTVWDYPAPPRATEQLMAAAARAFETEAVQTFEFEATLDDGTISYREGRVSPSGPEEFLLITRDITARKEAEQALKGSEERSRALLEAIPDNMFRLSREGIFLDYHSNEVAPLMDPVTIVGASVYDYPVPRELVERIMAAAEVAFDTGARQTVEYMLDDERGVRYQEARITPSGEDEFFVVVRDVTDRKQSEQDLQLSEQRSRALLEAIPDSMFRISLDGRILDYRVEPPIRLFRSEEDMIGSDVYDADFPREITAKTMALGKRAVETGGSQLHEYELEIDGELHHQEARITPSGEAEFLVIVRDVTQRKQQEQELQNERDFVAKVVNLAPTYFCVIRADGRIVRYNDTLGHAAGRADDDEVRRERFQDVFVLPEQVDEFERVLAIANSGRDPGEFELQLRSAAGEVLDVLWRGVDIYDETGERRYLLCGLDVTERIRQREELAAQRARIVSAGDEERRRLERNLHDGAQQRLVSLSLSLRLAQSKLASDPHAADELLSSASIELALALEELRELARGIHPAVLTERGLGPALESLADRAPLPVELRALPRQRFPKPVEAAAYYVVAEALTNVAKYASASTVSVAVAQENGRAVVEVVDDGVGGADPALGSGLRGLADRVEALEGRLAIESEQGVGTKVRAEIPYG